MSDKYVPLSGYEDLTEAEMQSRADSVLTTLLKRRSIRDFSHKPVPRALIAVSYTHLTLPTIYSV